jgi:hypothetical protein
MNPDTPGNNGPMNPDTPGNDGPMNGAAGGWMGTGVEGGWGRRG